MAAVGALLKHWRSVRSMSQLDLASEADVALAVATRFGLQIVDLSRLVVPRTVARHLPEGLARRFGLAPQRIEATGRKGVLHVAVTEPETIALLPELEAMTGVSLHAWITTPSSLRQLLHELYPVG